MIDKRYFYFSFFLLVVSLAVTHASNVNSEEVNIENEEVTKTETEPSPEIDTNAFFAGLADQIVQKWAEDNASITRDTVEKWLENLEQEQKTLKIYNSLQQNKKIDSTDNEKESENTSGDINDEENDVVDSVQEHDSIKKDFFGRVINVPQACSGKSASMHKNDIWYQYKEGYNNAVRKRIIISSLK